MGPDEATLRTKIDQAKRKLEGASRSFLDGLSEKPEGAQKQARQLFKEEVESVIDNLKDLAATVEKNEEL